MPQLFTEHDCYLKCASPALIRTTTPILRVNVAGPTGDILSTTFEIRTAPWDFATLVASTDSPISTVPPGQAGWQVPAGKLVADASYYWRARTADESGKRSAWANWQKLTVDTSAPSAVTISSSEYPEQTWAGGPGVEGNFQFASPSKSAARFLWSVDGGDVATVEPSGDSPRIARVKYTPPTSMVHTIEVVALDAAGNRSATTTYQLWVMSPPTRYAHWTMNETEGSDAADSGNFNAPASLTGDVSFGPGYVDGANSAVFTGTGQISTAGPVLDTTKSFTVMAWVNPTDLSLGDQTIVSQSAFRLHFAQAANGGAGAWCFELGADGRACSNAVPTAIQWMHVAATYNAVLNEVTVFVGGDAYGCGGDTVRTPFTGVAPSTGSLLIGQAPVGEQWHGSIDDVWAFQKVLDEGAICAQATR